MSSDSNNNHFDVIIVGAGLSGIGSAHHLKTQCPEKSFCVLEGMNSFGGTWLMHNYPGIRSDSDLFTFGYRFKPWTGKPIATGKEILNYISEVIEDGGLDEHIRYNRNIVTADWSNSTQLWTLTSTNKETGNEEVYTTNFLWMNQGYYKHAKGFTPKWPGMDQYEGEKLFTLKLGPKT